MSFCYVDVSCAATVTYDECRKVDINCLISECAGHFFRHLSRVAAYKDTRRVTRSEPFFPCKRACARARHAKLQPLSSEGRSLFAGLCRTRSHKMGGAVSGKKTRFA